MLESLSAECREKKRLPSRISLTVFDAKSTPVEGSTFPKGGAHFLVMCSPGEHITRMLHSRSTFPATPASPFCHEISLHWHRSPQAAPSGTMSTPKCYCLMYSTLSGTRNRESAPLSGTTSIADLSTWESPPGGIGNWIWIQNSLHLERLDSPSPPVLFSARPSFPSLNRMPKRKTRITPLPEGSGKTDSRIQATFSVEINLTCGTPIASQKANLMFARYFYFFRNPSTRDRIFGCFSLSSLAFTKRTSTTSAHRVSLGFAFGFCRWHCCREMTTVRFCLFSEPSLL